MMLLTAHINQKQVMSEESRSQSLIIGKKYNIDLSKYYMVGDTDTDIQAGKRAGTKSVFLGESDPLADAVFPDFISAVDWIIEDSKQS